MLAGGLQKYIFQGPYLFLYFPSQSQIKLHKLQYTQLGSKKKKKKRDQLWISNIENIGTQIVQIFMIVPHKLGGGMKCQLSVTCIH